MQIINLIYNTSKYKLTQSNSFLNDIFNFSVDLINQINNKEIDLKKIIEDIQTKFINQDFLNKIKEEIFAPSKNKNILKLLDANDVVDIINNLRKKLPHFYESGFNLLDINLNLSFLNDYIYYYQPLVASLKLALYNFQIQSNYNNYKIIFLLSDNEEEEVDEDTINLIKYIAENNNIYIFSIYIKPGKIEKEQRFYDSYEGCKNLFSICSCIPYNDPIMNFFIQKGWELPSSGECKLFVEINDAQNLYKLVDLINEFTAELNNSKTIKDPDSIIYKFGLTSTNYHVEKMITNFEAKNQGKTKTCYANAISAAILLTFSKFKDISEKDFINIKNEIIEISKGRIKNTFNILKLISGKYKISLKEVDEDKARQAIMKTRVCVTRFILSEKQWKNFNKFFKNNPKGILDKKDLGEREPFPKMTGHAVVLTHIYKDSLRFLNSYGTQWGDNGFFRVRNSKVINAKFIEVYIEPNDYSNGVKDRFNKFAEEIRNDIIQFLDI